MARLNINSLSIKCMVRVYNRIANIYTCRLTSDLQVLKVVVKCLMVVCKCLLVFHHHFASFSYFKMALRCHQEIYLLAKQNIAVERY